MYLRIINEENESENNDEVKESDRQKRKREIKEELKDINKESYKNLFSHVTSGALGGALIGGVKGAINNGISGALSGAVKGGLIGATATGLGRLPFEAYRNKKEKEKIGNWYKRDVINARLEKLQTMYIKKNQINENDSNGIKEIKQYIIDNKLIKRISFIFDENNEKLCRYVFNIDFWKKYINKIKKYNVNDYIYAGNKRIKDMYYACPSSYKFFFIFKKPESHILYGILRDNINIKKMGDYYVYFIMVINPNTIIKYDELLADIGECINPYDRVTGTILEGK